jgi:hypothetical protein
LKPTAADFDAYEGSLRSFIGRPRTDIDHGTVSAAAAAN